jgi:hypothetical protein
MRLWKRKGSDHDAREPAGDEQPSTGNGRQVWLQQRTALGMAYGPWRAEDMPEGLRPRDDPAKDEISEDEIDPSWRDPETAG